MNNFQKGRFSKRIVETMFNTVSDKQIGIWGFAFKKDTNDTRESAAIYICRDLLSERARLKIYDPQVSEQQIREDLAAQLCGPDGRITDSGQALLDENVEVVDSCATAAEQSHAIAVLTEWDEFQTVNLDRIVALMQRPAFLFDGRNVINRDAAVQRGFEFHGIGKP